MSFSSAAASPKVDNHPGATRAKIEIRRRVLEAIADASVFDAFAGTGQMHAAVWKDARAYVGCDTRWIDDGRPAYVADNRRVLRAIDLGAFNVFDLDAYGSPWEAALIIAARRPVPEGERVGIIVTDGAGLAYKANSIPTAVKQLAGLRAGMVGVSRRHDEVIDRTVAGLVARMRCTIERRWQAQRDNTGPAPRYIGLVLTGQRSE
jgi:hypothetical protein